MKDQLKKILAAGVVILVLGWLAHRSGVVSSPKKGGAASVLPLKENFVARNSLEVEKRLGSIVEMDTLGLKAVFATLVHDDSDMFDVSALPPFRFTAHTREQSLQYIEDVLARVHRASGRSFHVLDVQSIRKESSFDPADNAIIDRYIVNLFVQEKDSRQVHASAHNISMSFVVKPVTGQLQITDLYFITDHFYDGDMVEGDNPNDRFYRMLNPFHLQEPWLTTGDQVLPSDDKQISMLRDHHKDLRTPRYRCFGAPETRKDQCEAAGGYWDTPVKSNEECPFFRANKNYVNRLGGVHPDGDFCELPVNMKRVGYRNFSVDPAHEPYCYNCRIGADGMPGSMGPCCEEQRNKQLYPNLAGPDYAFAGDELERGQMWAELGERGLNWQKHPTQIRNVTNRLQKQPVFNAVIGPGPGALKPGNYPN